MIGLDELRHTLSTEADDVCSGAELLERVPPGRRSNRPRVVAAVATGVAIAAAVSVMLAVRPDSLSRPGASQSLSQSLSVPPTVRLRRMALSFGAHVDVPATWYHENFHGIPSTLGGPDGYLTTAPLGRACTTRSPQSCLGPNWFPTQWHTPDSGALMVWATFEYPVAARIVFRNLPGRRTTLDGRPAKLYIGAPTYSCPDKTYRELDAYVQRGPLDSVSPRFQLTACFGQAAPRQLHLAVLAMVHSFRIGR